MERRQIVALFAMDPGGIRQLGRSSDPELVSAVREHLLEERHRELRELGQPLHLVEPADVSEGNGS